MQPMGDSSGLFVGLVVKIRITCGRIINFCQMLFDSLLKSTNDLAKLSRRLILQIFLRE